MARTLACLAVCKGVSVCICVCVHVCVCVYIHIYDTWLFLSGRVCAPFEVASQCKQSTWHSSCKRERAAKRAGRQTERQRDKEREGGRDKDIEGEREAETVGSLSATFALGQAVDA